MVERIRDAERLRVIVADLHQFLWNEMETFCDETPVGPNPVCMSIETGLRLSDISEALDVALAQSEKP
jgi:hypothetical protein